MIHFSNIKIEEKIVKDKEIRKLCIQLAKCDRSDEIKKLLTTYKLWDDPDCWRDLGDQESNWSIIGAQQSNALGAIVEKIVNQTDSLLISECIKSGIDPEDYAQAPKSVKEAKEKLLGIKHGDHSLLSPKQRTALAKKLGGIVVTGDRINPTYTFFDHGEGQAPETFPDTFLGLIKGNKSKTAFLQGKYGMGGSGAIVYCQEGIQMILSRRNPDVNDGSVTDDYGFTITRTFQPTGRERKPIIRYLQIDGKIPSFKADQPLKLLPKENNTYPCVEDWHYGAFIKLYDFDIGPTLRASGSTDFDRQLSVKLTDPVYPVRIYERRKTGKKSPEATMNGLRTRLSEDKANLVESVSPFGFSITIEGQQFDIQTYVLKENYKLPNGEEKKVDLRKWHRNTGVIYEVNGQLNALENSRFYKTGPADLGYLEKHIVTIVDCSKVNNEYNYQLFMTDRERLRASEFSKKIRAELQRSLADHAGLKSLMEKRRREAISQQSSGLKDSIINNILKESPTLRKIFIGGQRISSPINTATNGGSKWKPEQNPTYFILEKQKKYSQNKPRAIEDGRRANICFLTDAPNDYLTRSVNKGSYKVSMDGTLVTNTPTLTGCNGIYHLNIELPKISKIGQKFELEIQVSDPINLKPFINKFWVQKTSKHQTSSQSGKGKKKNGSGKGKNLSNNTLDLPTMIEVFKDDSNWQRLGFNDLDGGQIKTSKPNGKKQYDIFINMDNAIYMNQKKEAAKKDIPLVEERYKNGMYIPMLSLSDEDQNGKIDDLEQASRDFSRTLSKVIVPIIKGLNNI